MFLLRIRLLLPFLQFFFLTPEAFLLRRIPGGFLIPKPLLLCLSPFFPRRAGRFHNNLTAVVVVQVYFPKELLEVSLVRLLPKLLENIPHLQVGFRLSAVQPALQDVETVDQARRVGAEIPLPHDEFRIGQGGIQLLPVQSFFYQTIQLIVN